MATKYVKETLGEFQDWKYFSMLEEKLEFKKNKKDEDEEKDGMDALKKIRDNLKRFEVAANDKILKYKEFWEENKKIADEFGKNSNIYKLWDSDYVAGVLNLPDEALSDKELNAEIETVDKEIKKKKEEDSEESSIKENFGIKGEEFSLFEEEKKSDEDIDIDDLLDDESDDEKEEESKDKDDDKGESDEDIDIDDETDDEKDEVEEEDEDLKFRDENESSEYFVIYDMSSGGREEIFRTNSPKVIKEFKDFFENEWKAAVRSQIQQFKNAQEEKRKEAEAKAMEELKKKKKSKLEKFLKESNNKIRKNNIKESFDFDDYDEPFIIQDDKKEEIDFDVWKSNLIDILVDEYNWNYEDAKIVVENQKLKEVYKDLDIYDIAEGINDKYS